MTSRFRPDLVLALMTTVVVFAIGQPVETADSSAAATPRWPAEAPTHVGHDQELADLVVVRAAEGMAVVRFGRGALSTITPRHRLGRHKAVVDEITWGRVVLEETSVGADGETRRALVVLSEGERGGKRYSTRSEAPRLVGVAPAVVTPAAPPKKR